VTAAANTPDVTDAQWMQAALVQAQAAGSAGEVPVGAVVVQGSRVTNSSQL